MINEIKAQAINAAQELIKVSADIKNKALCEIARALVDRSDEIITANGIPRK